MKWVYHSWRIVRTKAKCCTQIKKISRIYTERNLGSFNKKDRKKILGKTIEDFGMDDMNKYSDMFLYSTDVENASLLRIRHM